MYQRIIKPLISKSFFLFGARGTGKSTCLEQWFTDKRTLRFDLLNSDIYQRLLIQPSLIEEWIPKDFAKDDWVILDEVQKVPALLDHVHRLIEKRRIKFALTGSSARNLKRGGANLLAGRALENHLYPLTSWELGQDFDLIETLSWGAMPEVLNAKSVLEKQEFLRTYTSTYLKEEIREEQAVRKIEPFVRFLYIAAQSNGKILNMSSIARDAGVEPRSMERYFEILVDTWIGFHLEPFDTSIRRRQTKKNKFYFFDLGVKRALENLLTVPVVPQTYAFGSAFEHFFILECFRLNDYLRKDFRFSYLRTKDDLEVDLIVERPGEKKFLLKLNPEKKLTLRS